MDIALQPTTEDACFRGYYSRGAFKWKFSKPLTELADDESKSWHDAASSRNHSGSL